MARARRHAQQNAPGTPNQREAFLEQRDHTDQDNFEYNLNPGLEDNADDDNEDTDGFWVTMGKDEPDSIDLMVATSTKQYRQRACDFNWRTLLNHLHPVYMTQKIVTKNWANSNCYNDSNQICQCEKTYRMVDMVDIRGQKRVKVDFCRCQPDSIRLLSLGYLAGSPISPQTAFLLPLLIFYDSLWTHCHPRNLRKPFTAAVDMYRQLQEQSKLLLFQVLKLNRQQVLACQTCPACFGPHRLDDSVYPATTRNRLVVCLDGNFQHRHHTKASQNHEELQIPSIFLHQSEVDNAARLIREKEQAGNTPEQWAAQRAFQQDHTEVEEARMKKLAFLYERENVLDLMKSTPSEVRELMDSIEKEAAKLSEELALLSGGDMPAGNVEERKMRLLLWNAKSELFIQAVHLRAKRQPLLDTKNSSSRLGTKLKEKVFKAINARRPAIVKSIADYNTQYSEYKQQFPAQLGSDVGEHNILSYERLSNMSLEDAFWNDSLFYHCNAPWAINTKVQEGINCILILDRVQEEFGLIAQELVRAMDWGMSFHQQLALKIAYLNDRIALLAHTGADNNVPPDDIDAIQLSTLNQTAKLKVIMGELCTRITSHHELLLEWSKDFIWLWGQFPPIANDSFLNDWQSLMQQIQQEDYMGMARRDDIDDDLEEAVLDEVAEDGEAADDAWINEEPDDHNL
ncbi:hypothetical protein PCASD_17483 [Puccinia coronata f. sp. avenae]|uniref:CxC1-like cysteine cluster associated with KDZ transposases domain-containing protein n=1 Tax=Puccinia coronata f. sp. avenae TaxID=200324 RepID=A0A2N5TW96_9BASI|nr:hypothetical protein PCASD_17483 [Puccinia coronata f. sp. avenae]